MSATEQPKKLQALLRKLKTAHGEAAAPEPETVPPGGADVVIHQLVYSFMLWETTPTKASAGMRKLEHAVVDYNELRVCFPGEIMSIIGERYPRSAERARRLRAVLNDIYNREHTVTLERLLQMSKRDSRTYLLGLAGMPSFVASRVSLLTLGCHALPVDDRIRALLVSEEVIDESTEPEAVSGWLEHHVRADDAIMTYARLEAFSLVAPVKKKRTATKKPAARKKTAKSSPKAPAKVAGKSAGKSATKAPAKRTTTRKKTTRKAAS